MADHRHHCLTPAQRAQGLCTCISRAETETIELNLRRPLATQPTGVRIGVCEISRGNDLPVPDLPVPQPSPPAWSRGRIVGHKRLLLPRQVWAIRLRPELAGRVRDLAPFDMAIDGTPRGCDLARLQVADVFAAGRVSARASGVRSETKRPSGSRSPKRRGRRSTPGSPVPR